MSNCQLYAHWGTLVDTVSVLLLILYKLRYYYLYIFLNINLEYDSNNINPAITIIKHLPWFINNLEKAVKNTNSLMVVSILCMFK